MPWGTPAAAAARPAPAPPPALPLPPWVPRDGQAQPWAPGAAQRWEPASRRSGRASRRCARASRRWRPHVVDVARREVGPAQGQRLQQRDAQSGDAYRALAVVKGVKRAAVGLGGHARRAAQRQEPGRLQLARQTGFGDGFSAEWGA
jgi:hypothetical protein